MKETSLITYDDDDRSFHRSVKETSITYDSDDDDDTRDVSDAAISLNLEGHTTLDFDLIPYK